MDKYFNVTGCCNPQKHYMVDITNKFNQVMKMIERGEYFAINRPRQFGKTTMLNTLAKYLWEERDEYILVRLSFEGVDDSNFESSSHFCPQFANRFVNSLKRFYPEAAQKAKTLAQAVTNIDTLSAFISEFTAMHKQKVVVLIDEVDKSSNNQLFLSFLGMLRDKYLDRDLGVCETFQSVVLAGVHDVKSLKLKLRDDSETKLNSPWNIAADFNVDMSFDPTEIATMLSSYAEAKNVKMDIPSLSERIHYYTSGYPFLVSKICKIIDEEAKATNPDYNPKHWTRNDIDWSFCELTKDEYTTTNFDDLVKNIENNPELYELTFAICFGIDSEKVILSRKDPVVDLAIQYGILAFNQGRLTIHNRVYEQIIYDYLRSRQLTKGRSYNFNGYLFDHYIKNDHLSLKRVLTKFQEFMREHYSEKDQTFLEREGRLVFMSFLKPIINGQGFMWKEPVTGPERRMDLVVTYGKAQKDVIELKIWRGEEYHQQGLQQLSDYLDFQDLKTGFLLIFNFQKNKTFKSETITFLDKTIFAVWV